MIVRADAAWVNKPGAALTATADQLHTCVAKHKHSQCSHTDAEREDMKALGKQYANMMVTVSIQSAHMGDERLNEALP